MARTVNEPALRRAIYDRDGGLCGFCHEPVDFEKMHVDHIKPWAVGGETEPANLRPAHPKCNIGNGRRSVRKYVEQNPDTIIRRSASGAAMFVRVPAELKDALQRWADEEDRPLGKHLVRLLRDDLIAAGRWDPQQRVES